MAAVRVLLRGVVLVGVGVASLPGAAPAASLTLACRMTGGGYAVRDTNGRVVENGDGVPFAPQPHAVLLITAEPKRVRVVEGSLPHPTCASGPVLDSFAPVRFTWCAAQYEAAPEAGGGYGFRSVSRSTLAEGPHRGEVMEAFMVGTCVPTDTAAARR